MTAMKILILQKCMHTVNINMVWGYPIYFYAVSTVLAPVPKISRLEYRQL